MKYLFILFFWLPQLIFPQSSYTVSGTVKDTFGKPIYSADIILNVEGKYAISDEKGHFVIKGLTKRVYEVKASAIGFYTSTKKIELSNNFTLNITLAKDIESLGPVTVYAETASEKQNKKALTINSFDIKEVQNQSLGTEEILKAGTGLIIKQNGGLGSDTEINLNGLTGNAVRVYYDGIPLDILGGLKINAIPVDALDRVDVYKGVLPIGVGTDALGGGINLISVKQNKEYFRASYSLGSFNTHKASFNGLKKINKKLSLSTISYFNYSDNDYEMKNILSRIETESIDPINGRTFFPSSTELITARRFHDQYISGFIETKLRIKDLKWADRLEFGASYFGEKNEVQHGARILTTAVGDAEIKNNTFVQRIDYKKTFFKDKLKTRYYGVLSQTFNKLRDSTLNVYNWRGETLPQENSNGTEFSRPTLLRRDNLATAHRLTLNYKLTDYLQFNVSNYYQYSRIKGEDPIGIRLSVGNKSIDPNTIPSTINQNIFGASLKANLFDDKLDFTAFFKKYNFQAESVDTFLEGATIIPIVEVKNNTEGYGFGLKYQVSPNIFVRASAEQATRMPSEAEIFGNIISIVPNLAIEPEESVNWNVGTQFEKRFDNNSSVILNVNGFLRNQKNLIRIDEFGANQFRYINEAEVDGKGIELGIKINLAKNISINGNYTTQSNELASGVVKGAERPNIPLNFYNIGGNYTLENIFKTENNLQLSWVYLFIDSYNFLTVPIGAEENSDFTIPKQNIHNAGLTYSLKEKGLALSFNINNIFDKEVFDRFRIPRPGINYAFKINYSL